MLSYYQRSSLAKERFPYEFNFSLSEVQYQFRFLNIYDLLIF